MGGELECSDIEGQTEIVEREGLNGVANGREG